MSLAELQSAYSSVIGNYQTYLGTGYFNPTRTPKNNYIISKYHELKAIEEAKAAQALAESSKYHYTNLYRHIAETGYRIDGTPASDVEKTIAPYIPLIEPIQNIVEAVAWRQVAKSVTRGTTVDDVVPPTPYKGLTDQQIADKFVDGLENITGHANWGTKQFKTTGGCNGAIDKFNSLELKNVTPFTDSYGGQAYRGSLPDGTTVVVRSGSSYGTPTVEFQFKGRKYEIRYGD